MMQMQMAQPSLPFGFAPAPPGFQNFNMAAYAYGMAAMQQMMYQQMPQQPIPQQMPHFQSKTTPQFGSNLSDLDLHLIAKIIEDFKEDEKESAKENGKGKA